MMGFAIRLWDLDFAFTQRLVNRRSTYRPDTTQAKGPETSRSCSHHCVDRNVEGMKSTLQENCLQEHRPPMNLAE